jgi:hypothetical protein
VKLRAALTVAALVMLAVALVRQTSPGASARPAEERPQPVAPAVVPTPVPFTVPARDVFRYAEADGAEERPVGGARAAVVLDPPPALAPEAPPAPAGPRLIGLLRRGGTPHAALALDGEALVVKEGDRAGGYTVLAVDDEGVTLRDAAGGTVTLTLPPG